MIEGDLQCLLELLDVLSAVRVAEYPGEVSDRVGVVVHSVASGIGGVLWYPVWGLTGFWPGEQVLEMCMVAVQVWYLKGR